MRRETRKAENYRGTSKDLPELAGPGSRFQILLEKRLRKMLTPVFLATFSGVLVSPGWWFSFITAASRDDTSAPVGDFCTCLISVPLQPSLLILCLL